MENCVWSEGAEQVQAETQKHSQLSISSCQLFCCSLDWWFRLVVPFCHPGHEAATIIQRCCEEERRSKVRTILRAQHSGRATENILINIFIRPTGQKQPPSQLISVCVSLCVSVCVCLCVRVHMRGQNLSFVLGPIRCMLSWRLMLYKPVAVHTLCHMVAMLTPHLKAERTFHRCFRRNHCFTSLPPLVGYGSMGTSHSNIGPIFKNTLFFSPSHCYCWHNSTRF